MKGGRLPATTDANVVLGTDPNFFAGGKMKLSTSLRHAGHRRASLPMGLSIEEAVAGMYRVACNNMAQGVREVTIKRGFDPREFPFISAGGAGPMHSCLICTELEIPLQIVPRESSVLCAFGMLMSELKHDFVRTFVARFGAIDWAKLARIIDDMSREGMRARLPEERIAEAKRRFEVKFDCRYIKQYHEVSFLVPRELVECRDNALIARVSCRAQPALRLFAGTGTHRWRSSTCGYRPSALPTSRTTRKNPGPARTRVRRRQVAAQRLCPRA